MKLFKRLMVYLTFLLLIMVGLTGCVSVDDDSFTVAFDSQGADIEPSKTTFSVVDGEMIGVLPSDPIKTNYSFGGWFTATNGGGIVFDEVSIVVADITVYALWKCTVTYNGNDSNGGSVAIDTNEYDFGDPVTVLGNSGYLTKIEVDGVSYKFIGWTNSSGDNYTNGSVFNLSEGDLILYAKWVPYVLRDVGPAGGLVFYDAGDYTIYGWRYLEAAPSSDDSSLLWDKWNLLTGFTNTAIGAGYANSLSLANDQSYDTNYAASKCVVLIITNGISYTNWFLPSRDELALMHTNLHYEGVGNFINAGYWSSSEYDSSTAWRNFFPTGVQNLNQKDAQNKVRAIRAF